MVVVGTGMGGATLGYAMARAGKSVLFCEKGRSHLFGNDALRGAYAESFFPRHECPKAGRRDILLRAGRFSEEIEDISSGKPRRFIPFIGCGTGGSTALYGMALERFFPADFTPRANYPEAAGSTLPERWPITYEELAPYYEEAERLFRVRGTADALRGGKASSSLIAPPPLGPESAELFGLLSKDHTPYRLPSACEYAAGCRCCQGYLCPSNCKNDSSKICLEPAIADFGASLIDECEVSRLEATRSEVTGVVCLWKGKPLNLKAKIVVLAAGALKTPQILLNSSSNEWPRGLANDSGMVGRNLMRHYTDLYAVFPEKRLKNPLSHKEIALNDYYFKGGKKLGAIQSFGALPPASILAEELEQGLSERLGPFTGRLFRPFKPLARLMLSQTISRSIMLATIAEDLPFLENRVSLSEATDGADGRRLVLHYRIGGQENLRIESFRIIMKNILRPRRFILLRQAENNERLAHVCGTCRFGLDPKESVLDPFNRAHGISNLYVVDASFFPSSGGTNPALTIAANALRAAGRILSDR